MIKTIIMKQAMMRTKSRAEPLVSKMQFKKYSDPLIEIVVPVLNEEKTLAENITKLDKYMTKKLPYRFRITIADNGSTDNTQNIARELANSNENIRTVRLNQRGRGRALKAVWLKSDADILTYMDIDLSTGLDDFLPMIQPLINGEAGVGIGSRLSKKSQVKRSFKREFISRSYNKIIKLGFKTNFSDAQCGFKAIRSDFAHKILPNCKDNEWFFDTELLIKTENLGVHINERAVEWDEDSDSRVKIIKTAVDDLKGLYRVKKEIDNRSIFQKMFLPIVLVATGLFYLYGAMQNGMANSYYSAGVQAASQDWTAWLFGSLDSANYVSVDKPPIATMVMGLSARILGFSSFSMLLPSVLAGIGSVWLVYAITKRYFGFRSAAIAAVVLALTPSAALMFGFNNPDAILTFLLTASGYAFLRSLEQKNPLFWLALAGILTGFAFNTKMLQGLMVLPAMFIVYLFFAKPKFLTRIWHLLFAGIFTTISTFWWSILVWITPASKRPWVGSTNDNSIWSLIFGYNGFGRLLGNGAGNGGGGMRQAGGYNGAISNPGTTINVASSASSYGASSSVNAPQMNIGGMGGGTPPAGGGHGGGPGGTGFGGETGIFRIFNSDFGPNIGWLLAFALMGGAVMLWILRKTPRHNKQRASVIFWILWALVHIVIFSMTSGTIHPYYVVVISPAVAALAGISIPFLWKSYKLRKKYAILLPISVMITTAISAMILGYSSSFVGLNWFVAISGLISALLLITYLFIPENKIMLAGGILAIIACGISPLVYSIATVQVSHTGSIPTAGPSATAQKGSNNEKSQSESSLTEYLLSNRNGATWIVATSSANESAAIQLSTNQPVMAIGGFNGSDTPLTLDQFKQLVSEGKVQYYATSSNGMGGGGMMGNSEILNWIKSNGKVVNYGGSSVTLYKLSI